jgi:hypothetical protein
VAALYSEDAVRVLDRISTSTVVGREAIEKDFAEFFASRPKVVGKLVQTYAIEDRIMTISEYDA